MGLFDKIIFPEPIECNVCGVLHESTQTKMFSNLLVSYEVGDVLPTHIITGIVDEEIYCEHNGKQDPSFDQKIYFVIWNTILIDVVGDLNKAEQKLENFGVTNLLTLYRTLYKEKINFETKYSHLKSHCETYSEYLSWSKEKQEEYENDQMKKFPTFSDMMVIRHLDHQHPLIGIIEELDEMEYDQKVLF
jgi:hypothetical protein